MIILILQQIYSRLGSLFAFLTRCFSRVQEKVAPIYETWTTKIQCEVARDVVLIARNAAV